MPAPEMIAYVREQLAAGYSPGEIRAALLSQGWSEEEIQEGMDLVQRQAGVNPPVSMKKKGPIPMILALVGGILLFISSLEMILSFPLLSSWFIQSGLILPFPGLLMNMLGQTLNVGIAALIFSILVILGAIVLHKQGKEKLGGIMVIVFSVIALLGFSGFLVTLGGILGIIGGIIGIVKR